VGDLPDPDEFLARTNSPQSKLDRAPPEVIEWLERTLTRWAEKLEAGDPCGGSWSAIHRVLAEHIHGGITKSPAQEFIDRRWPELTARIRRARGE
jgi:hypothetical protein